MSPAFCLTPEQISGCIELITEERKRMDEESKPYGYNIGINVGPAGGQSIFLCQYSRHTPLQG
jgi:diadenosine tetraphosphate (Ap4A) HIT family hydrolase